MTGRESHLRTEPFRVGEPGDVTDLGYEHPCEHPAHPRQLLDCPIPDVVSQSDMDTPIEFADLMVVAADQIPQ